MVDSFFITGTDTNVGKTMVTVELMKKIINEYDLRVIGYKPVASGATYNFLTNRLENDDALALLQNSNVLLDYNEINPYCFNQATSPHIASQFSNKPIQQGVIDNCLNNLKNKADLLFIEGAGGWFTPLNKNFLFSNWVSEKQLPVILVIDIKLGCINHALLTQSAIKLAKLKLFGWIANSCIKQNKYYLSYLETLKIMVEAPLIAEIPFVNDIRSSKLSNYLDLSVFNLNSILNRKNYYPIINS